MTARDRAEARPSMKAIDSSLHLPARLQSDEVTPATFKEFPILRLFVPTRTMQHGTVGGRCVGACNSGRSECAPEGDVHCQLCLVLQWQAVRQHFDGPLVRGLDNEVHVKQLHVAPHSGSCLPAHTSQCRLCRSCPGSQPPSARACCPMAPTSVQPNTTLANGFSDLQWETEPLQHNRPEQ